MKLHAIITATLVLTALTASNASAQVFTIDWYTIDGGGAMNTPAGPFTLSATIGQPDACARAALEGGSFTITGGFWAAVLPRCDADFKNDGFVDSSDFFAFLAEFFAGSDAADFDKSEAVDSSDFFAFLGAFFAGCP